MIVGKDNLTYFYKKAKTTPPDVDNNSGVTLQHENGHIVVYVEQDHEDIVNTIIHESVHVFQNCMSFIGEEAPGKETQAYLIAEIAVNLLAEYTRLKEQNALHEKREA